MFDNGHFNIIGQVVGGWIFVAWNYLITWGVRFSLIYATTKYVVIVGAVLAAARLLRTLSSLIGWTTTPWRARVVVAAVVLPALQIHVAWSADPVASFPLFGYLPAMLGMLALDVAIRALRRDDRRSAVLAVVAFCVAILWYELNVAVVVAAGSGRPAAGAPGGHPMAPGRSPVHGHRRTTDGDVARAHRRRPAHQPGLHRHRRRGRRHLGRRARPDDRRFAAGVGLERGPRLAGRPVRAVADAAWSRLSSSAWPCAGPCGVPRRPAPRAPWWQVALVAAVPAIIWLVATLIQAVTTKIDVATDQLGFVYTYYAYGSIGVVLVAIIVVRAIPASPWWRRARPVLLAAALVFVVVQVTVNDSVQRAFDQRLAVIPELTTVMSTRPA